MSIEVNKHIKERRLERMEATPGVGVHEKRRDARMNTVEAKGAMHVLVPMKVYGDDAYAVWHRRPLPLDAPRVRYPGFKPERLHLKAGEIRTEGALPLPCDMILDRDVAVRLRDGTTIYTDVFRPVAPGAYPALVAWSPYGKELGGQMVDDLPNRSGVANGSISVLNKFEGPDPSLWVANGYVVLNPDTRGAYKSGGNLVFCGRQLAEDGYDFIEWAATQDWSNGRIGLAGNSWLAISQWFIAAERPPHLAAIAPWEGVSDLMREVSLRGGIPMLDFPEMIIQTLAGEHLVEDPARMAMTEQDDTLYWQDKRARLERIEVPAYIVASYDHFAHTYGTLEAFRRIASKDRWLRTHNTHEWPDFYDPRWSAELMAFFDHFLKGEANGWPETPQVRIAVLDPGRQDEVCREVEAWPPPGYQHERLYLTAEGALSAQAPGAETSIRYTAGDAAPVFFRTQFDTEAELIGYMKLKLWVEAEGADDMDLLVVVEKLDAEGRAIPRSDSTGRVKPLRALGFQRASRRRLDLTRSTESQPFLLLQGEERLAPGQVVPLEIAIWPTGMKLHAGETLQVMIAPFRAQLMALPFGSARISIPVESFTYRPDAEVEMMTLGGNASTSPQWSRDQAVVDEPRNRGTHILHMGGRYDSHLLVPLRRW